MKSTWLALLLLLPLGLQAQRAIPPGTVLPVRLDSALNAQKVKAGERIHARVMQDVPGTSIHRGAQVWGQVISASGSRIEFRFDTITFHGEKVPITTNLRALASSMEVELAQIPEGGADRSLPPELRTSTQIGGEQVYRGGGPLARGSNAVGEPTPYGAKGKPQSNGECRGAVAGNESQQALWLFSTDACGLYGYDDLKIEHAGRTNPVGAIEVASTSGRVNIRSGSGMLLRVQ